MTREPRAAESGSSEQGEGEGEGVGEGERERGRRGAGREGRLCWSATHVLSNDYFSLQLADEGQNLVNEPPS